MPTPGSTLRVFISSTSEDLLDYRAVARLAILDVGWFPEMMEHWGAMPIRSVQACYDKLQGCQLMLLIVGFRNGWVPTTAEGGNDHDAITALEFARARSLDIPVLALLANDSWPQNLCEDDAEPRAAVKRFRAEAAKSPVDWFGHETDRNLPLFRALVLKTLLNHKERLLAKPATPDASIPAKLLASAIDTLRKGRCIPFVGCGVYGAEALSTDALISALGVADEPSLATVAEYSERSLLGRQNLLSKLEDILVEQSAKAPLPAIYRVLCGLQPPLFVSATCDLQLERALESSSAQPVWIVCHVIRASNAVDEGKLLVFRGVEDNRPEPMPADKLSLTQAKGHPVVYKPLGSPLLNRLAPPDDGLDTVVMTEEDHLKLLASLAHPGTGLPTAFSRPMQRLPLVFLGYALDVWPYRLLLGMLESIGQRGQSAIGLAVRQPSSPIEDSAWHRLGVELLPMALDDFAAQVSPPPDAAP